jgi:murein DD-endopeptidase MepM/ murein hydrolase activator NlpD
MANRRGSSVPGRAAIALLALTLAAAFVPGGAAAAPSKQEVANAKAKVAALENKIAREQKQLAAIGASLSQVSEEVVQAQDQLAAIQKDLLHTQENLDAAQAQYDAVVERLNARAHQAFIDGPGTNLEFILGATSLTDLSDRVTFLDAVQQSDADLATEVQNLKNKLTATADRQKKLQIKEASVLADVRAKKAQVQASFDQQQTLLGQIHADEQAAKASFDKKKKQYAKWLKAQSALTFGNGILKVCPVDQPRSFGDGFGAPRYSGGFHLHMGDDILAPLGTPIRAPFDGVAQSSYNTLGGNSEYVTGATGYVYNAHLDHYSDKSDGPVKAGDIIGYVGWTGDAYGGVYHDHFEYHPNVIPDNWPASAYGYAEINGAINPYPLLVAACN